MNKTFVRIDLPETTDTYAETVLVDLAIIAGSRCASDEKTGDPWYAIVDSDGCTIMEFEFRHMALIVDAIDEACRRASWGEVPG
jgi:hypothetical protein